MKSTSLIGLPDQTLKTRPGLRPWLRSALRLARLPGREPLTGNAGASQVGAALRRSLIEDPFRTVSAALHRGGKLEPQAAATFVATKARQAQAELWAQERASKAGGAGARALAAQFVLAEPMLAAQLTRRLADAQLMAPAERQQMLNNVSRTLRQGESEARLLASIALAQDMPLKVALFLAEQRVKVSRAVLDMLLAWGESLREQAKLEQKASDVAHKKSVELARHRKADLENKLRLGHRHAALSATPSLHEVVAINAAADDLVVISPALSAATMRGRDLIAPPANRFLMGAFYQPLTIGYTVGGSQSLYTQQILTAGA